MEHQRTVPRFKEKNFYLSVDELDVLRALGVTVSRTELGTGLVVGEASHTTIGVHLDEVESAVETARKLGHVNVECELLVLQVEHVVGRFILKKVDTRADVRAGGGLSDELQREGIAAGRDTVGAWRTQVSERCTKYKLGNKDNVPE